MPKPVVAIVGRPNVGKSSLFNRLLRKRIAVVDDEPGVTRDRIYGEMEWEGKRFLLVDTGGFLPHADEGIEAAVREQALLAIQEADLVLFLVDIETGITDLDAELARLLLRRERPFLLVVNKVDNARRDPEVSLFYGLGAGEPFPVSALTGRNTGDLLDRLVAMLPKTPPEEPVEAVRIAVVGRPNVGKSSFVNAFLGQKRSLVHEQPGTTRDPVDTEVEFGGEKIVLVDTAGLRRKPRKIRGVEFYALMRTLRSVDRCDVAIVILDGPMGPTDTDKRAVSYALDAGKGVVLAVNKWDLAPRNVPVQAYEEAVREEFAFAAHAPLVFTSALKGIRVNRAVEMALQVACNRSRRVPTSELNEFLEEVKRHLPPPSVKGRPVNLMYITQTGICPPSFVFLGRRTKFLPKSYGKFLENRLRETFGFEGVPLRLSFRDAPRRGLRRV
ncbi:MAG TPA: ribosome biogenesis GTPase Der [Candidatus Latescibacteria bacterium]|nr:ribosome biogenesis GTPase Der [Candidatus Latescibacterota bacterium]